MHSPGGIPGVSSAITWNASASERSFDYGVNPLVKSGAGLILTVSAVGAFYRTGVVGGLVIRGLNIVTKPTVWGAYNLYKEQADIRHALKGGEFELKLGWRPVRLPYQGNRVFPYPWLDLRSRVEGSSSQDLVQNGGPPALLLPSGSPSSEANGSATSSAGGDSAHGRSSAGGRGRRRQCPKGFRWDPKKRKCVHISDLRGSRWYDFTR